MITLSVSEANRIKKAQMPRVQTTAFVDGLPVEGSIWRDIKAEHRHLMTVKKIDGGRIHFEEIVDFPTVATHIFKHQVELGNYVLVGILPICTGVTF